MKEHVAEYVKYLQEHNPFLLNNYNYMVAFAKSIVNTSDDDTYYWLKRSTTDNLSDTNLTPTEIISTVYNTLRELSEEIGNEFLEDVKKGKIKFVEDKKITSKFTAIRSKETRELEDYEFKIRSTGTITDIFHLIHEYTHKLMEKINIPHDRNKDQIDIYDEAAAIFVELLLAKRLVERYPTLREDINAELATRINEQLDEVTGIYETFNVVTKIQSGLSEDQIKISCSEGTYTYESICNRIINKDQGNIGIHFIGLLTAINIFCTSTNLQSDFRTIISEGKKGDFNFIASKIPTNPAEMTKYVMMIRMSFSDESSKAAKPPAKNS